jgi:hypothetical protein
VLNYLYNYPDTHLDHILTTLPSEAQVGGGILNHASWWIHGPDHMPIWASYRLPKHEAVQRTPWQVADRKLKMAIGRSNDKVVEDIQLASREWLEQHPPPVYTVPLNLAERKERLKSLQESLREAVQETLMVKPKKVSPGRYFFGDFPPQLQLAKIHLHTLVHLRALVNLSPGSKSVVKGKLVGPWRRNFLKAVRLWDKSAQTIIDAIPVNNREFTVIHNGVGHLPEWWLQAHGIVTLQTDLEDQMCQLRKLTKQKYRHLLSAQIKSAVEARETRVFFGRMKSAFASVLGTKQEPFLYDLMERVDGTQSADKVEIHLIFQQHFQNHFSTNPESLMQQLGLDLPELQSAHRWERLMDNPDEMVAAYMGTVDASFICKVPRKYVKLIAEAFQRTPAAIQVEAKIEAAMAISFSFEEFKVQVNGGGNSAGGGSGDTYRLL